MQLQWFASRAFEQALKAIVAKCMQRKRTRFGLAEQLQDRTLEQRLDAGTGRSRPQQGVGTPIGAQDLAAFVKNQQASPLAVEVVQAGIEDQLEVGIAKLVEDQAVFHRLAHHFDHAQRVRGWQEAVAGHIQHGDDAPVCVEDR